MAICGPESRRTGAYRFLSYSREDLRQAEQIAGHIAATGITVWCDQEQLHVGQTWPKALGEAIAASDALLLLWSSRAAGSAFVELEWCTALALKNCECPGVGVAWR